MVDNVRWLLEEKDPSIRYRTLVELLDKSYDEENVLKAKEEVINSKNVSRIFSKLDENHLFPHIPKYYGNFTTFNFLGALSEMGLKKDDVNINRIVDWILTPGEDKQEHFIQKEFQNEHAYLLDESNIGSCKQVEFLATLVRMGFLTDSRVERLVEAFIEKSRFDGGYLCKWKKSHFQGQVPKSCYSTTVNALKLYSVLPDSYRDRNEYQKLLDYFIGRKMLYSKVNPNDIIASIQSGFYATGTSTIYTLAYAMSKLGYGNIPEMNEIWSVIENKKDSDERIILEHTESKKTIMMDSIGKPNKWLTFYIMLSNKYKNNIKYNQ